MGRQVLEDLRNGCRGEWSWCMEMTSSERRLADEHPGVSALDLAHLAVMHRFEVRRIVETDTDFDRLPGCGSAGPVGLW